MEIEEMPGLIEVVKMDDKEGKERKEISKGKDGQKEEKGRTNVMLSNEVEAKGKDDKPCIIIIDDDDDSSSSRSSDSNSDSDDDEKIRVSSNTPQTHPIRLPLSSSSSVNSHLHSQSQSQSHSQTHSQTHSGAISSEKKESVSSLNKPKVSQVPFSSPLIVDLVSD